MKNIIFIVFFGVFTFGFSQQKKIDSLKRELKIHRKTDTVKFLLYYYIAKSYLDDDQKMSLKYSDSAYLIAPKLENKNKWLAKSLYQKGVIYNQYFQYKEALESYEKGADFAIKGNKTAELLGRIYHNTGLIYFNKDQYKKAITYHQKAFEIFTKFGNENLAIITLNSIGGNYTRLNDYKKALEYYFRVLQLAEKLKNQEQVGVAFGNIGMVLTHLERPEKAYSYFEKAIEVHQKNNYTYGLINNYNNYGTAKDSNNDPEGAIELYEKGLKLAVKPEFENLKYDLINNLGIANIELKNYDKAIGFLKQSSAYYKTNENDYKLAIANHTFAKAITEAPDEILRKNNINPSEKFRIAIPLLENSAIVYKEVESPESVMNTKEELAKAYEKNGDYRNALLATKDFQKLKDSLSYSENREDALKKEMQYESDKKETIAKAEIGKQKIIRNAIIAISSVALLAGVFLFLGFRKRQKIKAEQKELLLKAEISETELKALRAQMNPHFIFNSLNSIADYVNKNDAKSADYYLAKFAKLMRRILENSEEREIPLSEELKMLEAYMQLEASRLQNKFSYEIKVDENISPEKVYVPPMILQPFVENSIWHGLSKKEERGKLKIEFVKEGALLNCIIEDNGTGRKMLYENTRKSYGVKLTKDRIALFDKYQNSGSGVFYTDLEMGTKVEVKLPLSEEL